jgi:RNA 2',3'-cyclic 3'-phosphodiesterase
MPGKRLFVAIDLPDSVKRSLVRLDPQKRGLRWLPAEQMHLTLGFFGYVDSDVEEKLREKFDAIQWNAFFLPLTGLGTFPAKGWPKIIWIGVGTGHPHLFQLHKRVQDAALAAGVEPDLRPWHPHVTLARCRDVSAESIRPFLKANIDFDAGMIHVESFALNSSVLTPAGSIYTPELVVRA